MRTNRVLYSSNLGVKPVALVAEDANMPTAAIDVQMTQFSPSPPNHSNQDSVRMPSSNCRIPFERVNTESHNYPTTSSAAGSSFAPSPMEQLVSNQVDWSDEMFSQAATTITKEELQDIEDLEVFAHHFRRKRQEFELSQAEVSAFLINLYGSEFSPATMSRFETLNLSFAKMSSLRPFLKEWLTKAEHEFGNRNKSTWKEKPTSTTMGEHDSKKVTVTPMALINLPRKERKKIIRFKADQKKSLEDYFNFMPYPKKEDFRFIADHLGVDVERIRAWFRTRRENKKTEPSQTLASSVQALCTELDNSIPVVTISEDY